jgi:carbon storage regulator
MRAVCRKVGDRLRIGDEIVLTVLAVRGQQVHLKISAPESITIWREEMYKQKATNTTTEQTIEICAWLGQTVLGKAGEAS